ncbi:MAG: polar amino acid transporter, inner rane subunit [Herminiimonas sp.]|nr:polar amino acid transporter, inner rane subunit [Herminiimonas sp.]
MFLNLTPDQWSYLLNGALSTILLSIIGIVGGCLIGLPIALARISPNPVLRKIASLYVYINQGIPIPVAMFTIYFGLSIMKFRLPAVIAAGIGLAISAGAYLGEIWKGAILSVPTTQWEASSSLALTYSQRLRFVILPQAIRISIPPTVGFMVTLIKNTSYAVVIGMAELTYTARVVNNSTFQPFITFSIAAVLYFLICYPLSFMSAKLERSFKTPG